MTDGDGLNRDRIAAIAEQAVCTPSLGAASALDVFVDALIELGELDSPLQMYFTTVAWERRRREAAWERACRLVRKPPTMARYSGVDITIDGEVFHQMADLEISRSDDLDTMGGLYDLTRRDPTPEEYSMTFYVDSASFLRAFGRREGWPEWVPADLRAGGGR